FFCRRFGCGTGLCRRCATLNLYVIDLYRSKRPIIAGIAARAGNLLHERDGGIIALAENRVPAVQVRHRDFGDKELRAVRAWAGVCHGKASGTIEGESRNEFIFEAIAGVAGAVAGGISALDHETGNHAMKDRAVVEWDI